VKTILPVLCLGLLFVGCTALQNQEVTLDITGSSAALFTGYYETTGEGRKEISGTVPTSYTFNARKKYDVVAVQIARVGLGELTARLIADGATRDSATTTDLIGTITLEWIPR